MALTWSSCCERVEGRKQTITIAHVHYLRNKDANYTPQPIRSLHLVLRRFDESFPPIIIHGSLKKGPHQYEAENQLHFLLLCYHPPKCNRT
ncbi:hypothetical protein AQUCO_00700801v1 [Aquilegia coerulea]|uniref:Uncharacterized protein n=1 Tax=Aquilegia coerulea TaxID=218851 RepID=A0A2G5ELQ7_AQUCA|nr:hypothetical protein AQUCO_00700801v1 [Aquilegia coerulea]